MVESEIGMKRIRKEQIMGLSIRELLDRWPSMAGVFIGQRMACVGCPMARFENIREAADNYGLDVTILAARLALSAQKSGSSSEFGRLRNVAAGRGV